MQPEIRVSLTDILTVVKISGWTSSRKRKNSSSCKNYNFVGCIGIEHLTKSMNTQKTQVNKKRFADHLDGLEFKALFFFLDRPKIENGTKTQAKVTVSLLDIRQLWKSQAKVQVTPNRSVTVVPDLPFFGFDIELPRARETDSRLMFAGSARRTDARDDGEQEASTLNRKP